jgi:hypothetical protein
MSWELFYLICFVAGFVFSVLSFLSGALHLHLPIPKHFHFGHFGGGGRAGGGHGLGHGGAHGATGSHGPAGHGHSSAAKARGGANFPIVNPMTLAAFLTWFGATGYLMEHFRHVWILAGLGLSSLAGLAGASIIFWFAAKVLMAHDYSLDPLDYEMIGVLGRVSSSIRPEGTGEIIFIQKGARKGCPARCESGEVLPKGLEVVVTRYEQGVAYVRPWDELADSAGIPTEQEQIKD